MDVYDLPPLMTSGGDATTDFLVQVARKRGRLGRGGIPNLPAAAMTVSTKETVPKGGPQVAPPAMADQKEIVTEWAKEFKLEGLWGDDENTGTGDAMEQ
ncbi:hypothetical protein NUW58_g7786 [Xylaria curta]|uniref:Uncharacterized protein n=1 Tax=Xylaria curta TaxID=42375 RepID=A0ACC1NER0_9PEZI|nr:hypothetical protein NUW58_g7786 [Xylaria curta]